MSTKNMRKNQKKRAKKRAIKNNNNQNKNTKNNAKQPKPQIVYLREPKQKESIFDSLGGLLTKGLSALISGFGDYKVNENSLLTGGIAPPEVVNSVNDGGVIIRHREYLGDIPATIDFTITRYFINPGYTLTFPWLSHIATSFEQYKLRGMIFEFKSLSSDAVLSSATSSALGAVIMATQYDVLDTPFPNKFTMENYLFANSDKPSCSFMHPVECSRAQTSISELYIRGNLVPPNADQRLYDMGVFSIATQGMQAASGVAGELWCTYEIELYKSKVPESTEIEAAYDHFQLSAPTSADRLAGATVTLDSTLGGTVVSGIVYDFPPVPVGSIFNIYWQMTGTAAAITPGSNVLTGCDYTTTFDGDTIEYKQNTGTSPVACFTTFIVVTSNPCSYQFGNGSYPTGTTIGDLFVIAVPSNIT